MTVVDFANPTFCIALNLMGCGKGSLPLVSYSVLAFSLDAGMGDLKTYHALMTTSGVY